MLQRIPWLKKHHPGRARGQPQLASSSNESLVQIPSCPSAVEVERDVETVTFPVPHAPPTSPLDLPFPASVEMPQPDLHVRISEYVEPLESYEVATVVPRTSKFEDLLDEEGEFRAGSRLN